MLFDLTLVDHGRIFRCCIVLTGKNLTKQMYVYLYHNYIYVLVAVCMERLLLVGYMDTSMVAFFIRKLREVFPLFQKITSFFDTERQHSSFRANEAWSEVFKYAVGLLVFTFKSMSFQAATFLSRLFFLLSSWLKLQSRTEPRLVVWRHWFVC